MSSPQQQLPQAPAFSRRTSSRSARLHLPSRQEEPPIPPRLVGSPLLNNLVNPQAPKPSQAPWVDGDEFGLRAQAQRAAPSANSKFPPSSYASSRGIPT